MSVKKTLFLADATRIPLSFALNGSNTLVAAVASQKVKVLGMLLIAAADVDVTFQDSDGNALSGAMPMGVRGNGFVLPSSEIPYMETPAGKGLKVVLSGAVQCSGFLIYIQE